MEGRLVEKPYTVTLGTYCRYFGANSVNYFLLPLVMVLFIGSEIILTFFLRFLAEYEGVREGSSGTFGGSISVYWGVLGGMLGVYLVGMVVKYFLLYLVLLKSNQNIHQQMVDAIVRSPGHFFDVTPSGVLINKFSNDLGILDNSLALSLMDTL